MLFEEIRAVRRLPLSSRSHEPPAPPYNVRGSPSDQAPLVPRWPHAEHPASVEVCVVFGRTFSHSGSTVRSLRDGCNRQQ